MAEPITLLLVDDQQAIRQGLRMRLMREHDMQVVGEACDGTEAIKMALAVKPDVVLLDLELPRMDGITTTTVLQTAVPRSAIVILSLRDDAATQTRALAAGAVGFVSKHGPVETLLTSIRRAVR